MKLADPVLAALLAGHDPAAHVYPNTVSQNDLAHPRSALRVVSGRSDPDCPLCLAGICAQRLAKTTDGGELVIHGVRLH